MKCSQAVIDCQHIVDHISRLGTSDRLHKKDLSKALKAVKSAGANKLTFDVAQAGQLVFDLNNATRILFTQNSRILPKKTSHLSQLSHQLQLCLTYSIDHKFQAIETFMKCQEHMHEKLEYFTDKLDQICREEVRRIEADRENTTSLLDQQNILLDALAKLDASANTFFDLLGLPEAEKKIAVEQYMQPSLKINSDVGNCRHDKNSGDQKTRESFERQGVRKTNDHPPTQEDSARNIDTPALAKVRAWMKLHRFAEQRVALVNRLNQFPQTLKKDLELFQRQIADKKAQLFVNKQNYADRVYAAGADLRKEIADEEKAIFMLAWARSDLDREFKNVLNAPSDLTFTCGAAD